MQHGNSYSLEENIHELERNKKGNKEEKQVVENTPERQCIVKDSKILPLHPMDI